MWQQLVDEGLRIRHFRYRGKLLATLVYEVPNVDKEKVSFGFSFVSKKDSPNLERGRQVAYQRFLMAEQGATSKPVDNILSKFCKITPEYPMYKYGSEPLSCIYTLIECFKDMTKIKSMKRIKKFLSNSSTFEKRMIEEYVK